ncbi:MAG TPA: response regulator transcription factor [Thermoleophilaceae bacterium]|jgi:DNA-binding NarL/FixJ family response regulator|nr:response regulator transcription factor [Thermoleophilaceae bacterium]
MAKPTAKTRCLAVDDHPTVREGIALMLRSTEDLELVATVEDGEQAIEATGRLKPEVVIMDVRLPGIDGISAVRRIQEDGADVETVIFSAYGDRRLVSDAIAAGARGYVMKGSPPGDLVRAIRTVTDGKAFVDPSLSPVLLATDALDDSPLSEREREILQLLAEGYHTDEIARRIGLSGETVKSDTKRAIQKLDANTRVHAVAIALRQAIIE